MVLFRTANGYRSPMWLDVWSLRLLLLTTSPSIAEFPQDILLELAKEFDVADLMNFLSVCRLLRELQSHRSLWLTALNRIREVDKQPLPISTSEALSTLSLPELQHAARQANRLMKNFKSDNLVLRIYTNQPCLEIKGKVLIGGFVRVEDTGHLVAICIDFCDRDHISISHIVSPVINGMFINPIFSSSLSSWVLRPRKHYSWHMDADIEVQSTPGDFDDPLLAQCLPFGRNLYVFHRLLGAETAIQRGLLPRAFEHHIPTFDAAAAHNNTTRLAIPYVPQRMQPRRNFRTRPRCNQVQSDSSVRPHYDIAAVTFSTTLVIEDDLYVNLIHFWTGRITRDENIEFGKGYAYQHHGCIHHMAVGGSGTYILLLVMQEPSYLGLLNFSAAPAPHTTFRKLDIADYLVSSCAHVAFYDSLGWVLAVDNEGRMTAISYM
ncbi:hypothetical protein B0H10DRAFT_2203487 [Mycena sp. CBHHK59/15]|nr:hypothetical protein B0H10DRAFT_2203487 [Mycena sp. CBHHK59/15]